MIGQDAWTPIEYTDAVFDEPSQTWISRGGRGDPVHDVHLTQEGRARSSGRLEGRRIPDLNLCEKDAQATLFDTWRFHAFFTTSDPKARRHS